MKFLKVFLVVTVAAFALASTSAQADMYDRANRFTVGSGIGFATGGGITGFDWGLRADYHIWEYFAPGIFFDFLAESDVAFVIGPRFKGTLPIPQAPAMEVFGALGVAFAKFPGNSDADIQISMGVNYMIMENFLLGTDMGFNFLVDSGSFVFNWLPFTASYRF